MIHPLLITLAPMVAAAVIVMVGGFQLSKKSTAEIIPHNKERLLSFSHGFQQELYRLEKLYLTHLGNLSQLHREDDRVALRSKGQNFYGIHTIYLFHSGDIFPESKESDLSKYTKVTIGTNLDPPPPVVTLVHSNSLSQLSDTNIPIPLTLLESPLSDDRQWIFTPSRFYTVHHEKPTPETLVAIVIDYRELHRITTKSLAEWSQKNALPLTQTNERIIVRSSLTPQPLLSSGPDHHGPAAAIIPYRSLLGDFEITAWDSVTQKTVLDPTILTISSILATSLCLAGFLLFSSHQRTIRLALQRVSFVNQVSHELGTPLTNLNLNLELAKEFFDTNPTESKKRLATVSEELTRLSRLVTNVLTFSRKDRDKLQLHLEACLPHEVVSSALDSFRPALDRLNFKVETKLPPTPPLLLDPDALFQITTNLISNVEKYASIGRELLITLSHQNNQLVITVTDHGSGIPSSQEARIFEPFRRLSQNTNEGASGVGLGLAIARELAEKMEGSLQLIPSSKGACFHLTLPATPAP